MKLRKVQTIHVYEDEDEDENRFRHIDFVGTQGCWAKWQQLKHTDDGDPWWANYIDDEVISELDAAVRSESLENNPMEKQHEISQSSEH